MNHKRTQGEGPNPSGLCMCGCGERTAIANKSDARRGDVGGTPKRYRSGHYDRVSGVPGPNPSGLCMCGCGESTTIAPRSIRALGWVLGTPVQYVVGHNHRKSGVAYIEQDCGYETPCWVWQRKVQPNGYGRTTRARVGVMAHRAYYERLVGPVPDGLDLDHLCRNRACVNPAHLEAVTRSENLRRGILARRAAPAKAAGR